MNSAMLLIEKLTKERNSFYKKYNENSMIEYYTKDKRFGVQIKDTELAVLDGDGKVLINVEYEMEGYEGSAIQPENYEFDANTSDSTFVMYLFYDKVQNDDILVDYNIKNKTIRFRDSVCEFIEEVEYPFSTESDVQEILFKLSLEYNDVMKYSVFLEHKALIETFKKLKLKKDTTMQIWNFKFPENIHELIGTL